MKKILLTGASLLSLLFGANAQSPYGIQVGLSYYDLPSNASSANRIVYNPDDQSISATWIQSITALQQPTFERGAGYNHYKNGSWQFGYLGTDGNGNPSYEGHCRVNNGCTQEYSGWPEIINFPKEDLVAGGITYTDVSKEILLTHSSGLKHTSRYYRSTGLWDPTQKLLFDQDYCEASSEGLWPRAVSQGTKYIHMIAINRRDAFMPGETAPCEPYTSVDRPFLYYRSSDKGETWDVQNRVLPGMEDTTFFKRGAGDSYAIAANKDVVAVVAGGFDIPWVMWKSRDKGLTWEYTIIRDFDPGVIDVDGTFNTGESMKNVSDGAHSIVIDDNGTVHCFTGIMVAAVDTITGEFAGSATFGNNGVWYWNDDMQDMCEPAIIAEVVDLYDASGNLHANPIYSDQPNYEPFDYMSSNDAGYFASSTTMPNAAVDANGNIYMVYSSDVEGTFYGAADATDPDAIPTRDIYMVWSDDGGNTWSREINVAGEIANQDDGSSGTGIEEDVYPSVAHYVGTDRVLHMLWNMDYKPGSDVQLDVPEFSQQYITYYGIDVSTLIMDAKTMVTATPNTIAMVSDTIISGADVFNLEVTDGYYSILSPMVSYVDSTYDSTWCVECDSSMIASMDSIWCTGCGAGGIDTLVGIDTVYQDTLVSVALVLTDLNADGDNTYCFGCNQAGAYAIQAVYGNACPDPEALFNVYCSGATMSVSIMVDDTLVGDSLFICAGDQVDLSGFSYGGDGSYAVQWDTGVGVLSSTNELIIAPSQTTKVVFYSDDQAGEMASDSVVIVVWQKPTGQDAGLDQTLLIEFPDNCRPFAQLGPASNDPNSSYSWTPVIGMTYDDAQTSNPTVLPTETTTYTLEVTDMNQCKSTDIVTITVTGHCIAGLNQLLKGGSEDVEMEIYPNPATSSFTITVDELIQNVVIYNVIGSKVYESTSFGQKSLTISTNSEKFNPGVYLVQVWTKGGMKSNQLVIRD